MEYVKSGGCLHCKLMKAYNNLSVTNRFDEIPETIYVERKPGS